MWKKAEGDICRLMRQHPDLQKMAAEYKVAALRKLSRFLHCNITSCAHTCVG